ncbi:Ti-type conjugative transfer relaxase TraA [Agrobacterium tumefaciens]|uniref:Ti-type conjugative transfer relaxase TraA n=1 Tax=Agrobacterium tumefaciens TaxID=358 RepID=A0AA44F2F9_AGRTU|nr:Ti-type conjugative transfer relaxase TraA [Agrobacterium tumefaciens]NTB88024.1 Ti-type conjugative transfer relaxase TraA [Agrobacterium tumefaciens]NTC15549.1 Ti-type conjugative transfer relaxase TraA [Agrobacterium tumefaciens]NTC27840.1 Ti-type conjugative transfer relaxase TraA [Agrobacterium tumefaciens]NTC55670.1 Ti-type conjugative transfer relaxase TraA [Agrobacterium tumefaciens]NTC61187.1 Ti-type conjugative transfer relaxase TraA [Agrobacterium tumefaciens]
MAIYHLSTKPVSRSSGRSAVASAAYRCAVLLVNHRDGLVHDFTRKEGVEHSEIVLPQGVSADWAFDRSALWNAAEFAEKRKDARVAREFEIALPHELSPEGRLKAARAFAQDLANRYGAAVDFAIHSPSEHGDIRNHHAHVLMTTRQVREAGLGEKTCLEHKNARLLANGMATTDMQLRDIRQSWEGIANRQLQREGLDVRIDHRSHAERGLELSPTEHMGVHASQMQQQGMAVERGRLDDEAARQNAALIRQKPEQVLTLISHEKSVFDRHDIAKTLHRYINDDAQTFQNAFAAVLASPALVELQAERIDAETGDVSKARYSTRDMIDLELGMARSAERLHQAHSHGVDPRHVDRAMERQDNALRKSSGGMLSASDSSAGLSDEQRHAIAHITGPERIAAVVGFAGAGKSTMLAAAREAWEAQGYQVHGAALAGKAAEGLEESSGMESRTLASWSYSWDHGRDLIGRSDVFVIDEAGMVGSRQLARFIGEAEERGAKIVLVGDHEQLQAIGAGAPFRAIAEQIGHVELSGIRRQRHDWQRQASVAFATHKTAEGLAAYRDHGDIHFAESRDKAMAQIVRDYVADSEKRADGTRVAMAHRRADVRALNAAIRSELRIRQRLERGHGEAGRELTFQTNNGKRAFAAGDRIIFLENNRDLRVKNGMLGTVEHVEPGKIIARLDGRGGDSVSIPTDSYQAIDHGYATTIHKNQGATVDRAFVLASRTMDRHLTYVAMTRHRDGVQLYADIKEFTNAGRLVDHGVAPYENHPQSRESYFVTLENDKGERHTVWGVDLKRAMRDASPKIGDRIGLQHQGATPVTLPDGTQAERNAWRVVKGDALAYEQLTSRLSRSGAKEATLDYVSDFAERRGIASDPWIASDQWITSDPWIGQEFGVRSEIELASAKDERQEVLSRAAHLQREQQGRPSERQQVYEERAGDLAGPVQREDPRIQVARTIDDGRRDDPTDDNKGYRRIRWSEVMSQDGAVPAPTETVVQQSLMEAGKPAPLVPAITRHDHSIEEVARERAMSVIDQRFDTVESVARHVFRDPVEVAARLRTAMTEKEGNGKIMAKAMAEQPERFGELRGKSGLFGNNKERKEALQYARSLSAHIGYVSEAWERRLGEERQSEQWQREQRDILEVPGLTPRSAEILAKVEKMPVEKRSKFIKELRSSPEGRAALDEATLVAEALTRRFGSSDPRRFAEELAARPELAKQAEQIKTIARMVHRTRHAELNHDHALRRQLNRSQGLGLSR